MTDAPITIPIPARPARIAALHAGALFIAQEAHLPVPAKVEMTTYDVHYGELCALAEHYGVEIERGDTSTWITIPISLEILHGVEISYTLFAARESIPATTPMDIPARGAGITFDDHDQRTQAARCDATWEHVDGVARCVKAAGHTDMHFYDDDETAG